jgi:hypothetical protein
MPPSDPSNNRGEDEQAGSSYHDPDQEQEERWDRYQEYFRPDKIIELKNIGPPKECSRSPDLANELIQAYCFYSRINVKVWSNYDSVERGFYLNEGQLESCGELCIQPDQLERILALSAAQYQFWSVCLDIGTPFRTIFKVHLNVHYVNNDGPSMETELVVSYEELPDFNGPHNGLRYHIESAMERIQSSGIVPGQTGLTVSHLQDIAAAFVFRPKDEWEFHHLCIHD